MRTNELINKLFGEIVDYRALFEYEFDNSSSSLDLRWSSILEGKFIDQLDKLSLKVGEEVTAHQIGEYVISFFNSDFYVQESFDRTRNQVRKI